MYYESDNEINCVSCSMDFSIYYVLQMISKTLRVIDFDLSYEYYSLVLYSAFMD